MAGIIGFFVCAALVSEGTLFDWLIMENNPDWELADFYRQIGYAEDLQNIYFNTMDAPFPAISYIFFHFLYSINPQQAEISTWLQRGYTIPYEPVIFVMWTVIQVLFILYFIHKITKFSLENAVCFTIVLFMSLPYFAGAFERGNTVLVTVLFLLAALYLREQNGKWQQELALIMIALAAGSKAIPCIMGLLYIREKNYQAAIHLFIWGIIIVILPFIFTGGIAGFIEYLKIVARHGRIFTMRWTSFAGFVNYWVIKFMGNDYLSHKVALHVFQVIVQVLFLLTMILFTFRTKYEWKAILYLSMLMAYVHSNSYRYYTIYLTLPFVMMICEDSMKKFERYIYYALFGAVFTIPIWCINGNPEHGMCAAAYLLCIYSIIQDICSRD